MSPDAVANSCVEEGTMCGIRIELVAALLGATFSVTGASGADWPQWGGTESKNMASEEKGLPSSFEAGEKDPRGGQIKMDTMKNVRWAVRVGQNTCSTPAVAAGKVFIGSVQDKEGVLVCLDERSGKRIWQWRAPRRDDVPAEINGRKLNFGTMQASLGVCSSPLAEGDRVYFVNNRCEVVCLDARGGPSGPEGNNAKVLWTFDMWRAGVRPSDACNGSAVIDGDCLYVGTSNGVDRLTERKDDDLGKPPAPDAPNLIVLDKKTGWLLARDDTPIGPHLLHGQWSSPSIGIVGGRKLVFFGGGNGVCYAFAALTSVPEKSVKLKTIWSYDCDPPEYKSFGGLPRITHYCRGDRRRGDSINTADDGTFVGMSEIIATPVFYRNRVYVAIGRDPAHGRGRGALHCIDATKTGDVTKTGRIWCYQGLDRSLATVSIAEGLVYVGDVAGRLHCLDAETGRCYWIHEGKAEGIASSLAADGKIYYPTTKHLWVLASGRELKVLAKINLGAPIWTTPVAANGTLYVASKKYLWAVHQE
jgi:outer membrane protein assembly factor BamB